MRALSGEADDVELVLWSADERSWAVRNREIVPEVSFGQVAVGLRALRGGRLAMAATATLDPEENARALRAALRVARPSRLSEFAAARPPPLVDVDPELEALAHDPKALHSLAVALRDGFFSLPRAASIEAFEGAVGAHRTARAVVTRRGESTVARAALAAWADVEGAHSEIVHAPRATPEALAEIRGVGRAALLGLPDRIVTPEELGTGELPVLLHPRLAEAILRTALQEKLLAESAAKGLSDLRPGDLVADESFSLWDSSEEPGLSSHAPTDDEGTPGASRAVIERGRFTGFLGSRASCEELGIAPTGNGFRTPMIAEPPNEAPVRDRLSGLIVEGGEKSFSELVQGMERGLVLVGLLGLHGADRARASFSCTVYDGLAVRDGKLLGRLAPGRWNASGRLLADGDRPGLLSRIERSREQLSTGRSRLPHLLVRLETR